MKVVITPTLFTQLGHPVHTLTFKFKVCTLSYALFHFNSNIRIIIHITFFKVQIFMDLTVHNKETVFSWCRAVLEMYDRI